MNFVSIRIITDDVARLVAFYEPIAGVTARWGNELFAELRTSAGTLAIASSRTVGLFGDGAAGPADNHSVIIEFRSDDVDAAFDALSGSPSCADVVMEPATMPWGNRSALVRDPDGNLVNLFTPVGDEALARNPVR
ncbi:VOC family protein [Pseudonocardia endophytica]|uniref:Glyoxalase/bleomycin resistance protein/dioxygenase superfamily protein n=1 Tax=Pseudonocardia endophytica TaxID=401976 RepID=A0A4R1HQV6_PSEEN|nr:VOC family protein [Pseudonocardia endophytica]TCK24957.1 glyoxalase/bleomycin resistance protein/dioxygenase superfamily protein [Pseudonocardia endophytica]